MNIFRNVTKGSFVRGASLLIMLAGAVGTHAAKWGVLGFFLTGIPLWCLGLLASTGGVLFYLWPMVFGSEREIPLEQIAKKEGRMLFLYLRPFELDARNILQLILGASVGLLAYASLFEGVWWALSFLPLCINISKEQKFKGAFEPVGEFITFGKPKERLQPIGASRIYADDNWQQEIMNYMAQARLVIVRPGKGKSIKWEVEQVLRRVPPERILFYLRFRGGKKRREVYEEFRNLFQEIYHRKLPELPVKYPYLIFDSSWNPYFMREANRPGELFRQLTSSSGDIFADALRPVLSALKIDIPASSSSWDEKIVTVLMWVIVLSTLSLVVVSILLSIARVTTAFMLYLLSLTKG